MIKKYLLLIVIAVTAFVVFITFSINTSITNKKRIYNIENVYFPVLERVDATIVRLDKIENLLVQFVITGEENLLQKARQLKNDSDAALMEIPEIYQPYKMHTDELLKEFDQYFMFGVDASSLLHHQQFSPSQTEQQNEDPQKLQNLIFKMNNKLASLHQKIDHFRKECYESFTITLHTANSDADKILYLGIAVAFFNLIIITILVYFIRQHLSMLHTIQEYNLHLEEMVEERTKEIKQIQEELLESKKMASLGGLVNGIAHEINTPLGVCITAISHLEDQTHKLLKNTPEAQENKLFQKYSHDFNPLEKLITSNLNQIVTLIDTFKLAAANQSIENICEINLHHFLSQILMTEQIKCKSNNIELLFDFADDINITTYPSVLTQVIISLIENSMVHAFTFSNEAQEKLIKLEVTLYENSIALTISDNGIGMEEDVIENLFEPFYTTKRGQGSCGLGMHIVYNLINHKLMGKIKCESIVGEGSYCTITLPTRID